MTEAQRPAFAVTTRASADADAALGRAAAQIGDPSAVWSRGDEWLLGFGVALTLEFAGPDRMTDAADAWRAILESARIDDEVAVDGSGLIAFGTFAFADSSTASSVLVVPLRVVGRRRGQTFVTDIADPAASSPPGDPASAPEPTVAATTNAPPTTVHPALMNGAAYERAVAEAVARIRAGEIEKVVLARDLTIGGGADFDLEPSLRLLRSRYRDAWTFAVDGFFGASPETLVASDGTAVTARVLAGTAPRHADPVLDSASRQRLEASMKDRFEHALAVDSLVITLGPSVDDLVVGRRFALALPNVWHLATDVTAHLVDGSTALDLVAALHPTAAVAGVPRLAALDIIAALEPFDRGRYAGPVGWVGAHGSGEWAVGLRSAQLLPDGTIRAFAGAGIVAGSDPATELTETGWKFTPIREALGLDVVVAPTEPTIPRPAAHTR